MNIVVVRCDDYIPYTEEQMNAFDVLGGADCSALLLHGISLVHVSRRYIAHNVSAFVLTMSLHHKHGRGYCEHNSRHLAKFRTPNARGSRRRLD